MKHFPICLLLAGCGPLSGEAELEPDLRVDHPGAVDPDSANVRMCVNGAEVYLVWRDDRSGSHDLWLNRSVDGGASWLPADVRVDGGGDADVWLPQIACTDEAVYVVWEDARDSDLENHQIRIARSLDQGASFLPDVLLDADPEGMAMSMGPQVSVSGDAVYVAWFDNRNGAFDIYVASSLDAGASFADPVRVDSTPAGSAYAAWPVLADGGDQLYVAWEDTRDGHSDIDFAAADADGPLGADIRLDTGDAPGESASFTPQIAADGDHVHVVWHDERNGLGHDVLLSYSADGGQSWLTQPTRVDDDLPGFFNSLYPVLAVDGDQAFVAWQDDRLGGYDIYARTLRAGLPDGDEIRIDTGDEAGFSNAVYPVIARSEALGTVMIGWEDNRTDGAGLYGNYAEPGGTFAPRDWRIDSMEGDNYAADLQLAVVGDQAYAGWLDGRNGTTDIYFHRWTIGAVGN